MSSVIFKRIVFILTVLLFVKMGFSQEGIIFPVPNGNPLQLFYLQRTQNTNTIVYELNYKNGQLNTDDPVHVFWIRYGEKGQRAELSYIQRNFAYGIKAKKIANDIFELHFVSYKKRTMYLRKAADNKFYVYTSINSKQIMLNRIYLKINGGSFWSPNIEAVELKGVDAVTGKEVVEEMKI